LRGKRASESLARRLSRERHRSRVHWSGKPRRSRVDGDGDGCGRGPGKRKGGGGSADRWKLSFLDRQLLQKLLLPHLPSSYEPGAPHLRAAAPGPAAERLPAGPDLAAVTPQRHHRNGLIAGSQDSHRVPSCSWPTQAGHLPRDSRQKTTRGLPRPESRRLRCRLRYHHGRGCKHWRQPPWPAQTR
jgi:hypothetical protein